MYAPAKTKDIFDFADGSYFGEAFGDPDKLIKNAEVNLRGLKVEFDSMVAIGLSGYLVLPLLARHFDVPFLALRKQSENCHDSYGIGKYGRGSIGHKWLLVDDFVCTGKTMRNAISLVKQGLEYSDNFTTEFVGTYCYAVGVGGKSTGQFCDPHMEKQSLAEFEYAGETIVVDALLYQRAYNTMADYIANKTPDPKGRTMAKFSTFGSFDYMNADPEMVSKMVISLSRLFADNPDLLENYMY